MKKTVLILLFSVSVAAVPAMASVSVNIPLPPPPHIVIEKPPRFLFAPPLGFHVSVESPHDIIYIGNEYFLYDNGYYFRSHHYNGPWVAVDPRHLPPGLRKHKYHRIRHYRDEEFRRYDRNRAHYRGKWHDPHERHRDERRHDDRRYEERRYDDRRHGEGRWEDHPGRGGHR